MERKVPSLVDLCVQLAIDNVRHLSNVGDTDFKFLDLILPHCNIDQLMHVEDCSGDRDLSPVTDKLWKNFFLQQFVGSARADIAVQKMKKKKETFKWRELYEGCLIKRRAPSLVDMCVQLAIDNVSHLGNVGATDFQFLERILPHCNMDQLRHVEDCTKDIDLSPVTDKLWKNIFLREYGSACTAEVVTNMEEKKATFKWRKLYEFKKKRMEDLQEKAFQRVQQRYKDAEAEKRSRSVKVCTKVPPPSSKRFFYGGPSNDISGTRSSIMKKAKVEFLNSPELKNLAAVRNKTVQRRPAPSPSISRNPGVSSVSMGHTVLTHQNKWQRVKK